MDRLSKEIAFNITQFVLPALQRHNDELFVVENLLSGMRTAKFIIFWNAEQLLILVNKSFPERLLEILALLRSKIKDSNDRLFIAELLGELNIAQQQL